MPSTQTEIQTKTSTLPVTIASSLMLATSAVALFLSWGMMATVGLSTNTNQSVSEPSVSSYFSCPKEPEEPFGVLPASESPEFDFELLAAANHDLWTAWKKYQRYPDASTVFAVYQAAAGRKPLLVRAIRSRPTEALHYLYPSSVGAQIAPLAPGCLEEIATFSGLTRVSHADFFSAGQSQTRYQLVLPDRRLLTLRPAGTIRPVNESGITVAIRGYAIDDELAFDAEAGLPDASVAGTGITILEPAGNPPTLGEQRLAVLPVIFQDQDHPFGSSDLYDMPRKWIPKLNEFFREVSYGQVTLTGTLYEPRVIPVDTTCASVDDEAVAAFDPVVDFRQHNRIYVVTADVSCGYGGIAGIGLYTWNTQDGETKASIARGAIENFRGGVQVAAHELGHGFGYPHASFVTGEYGDPNDMMGSNYYRGHYSAGLKDLSGWLSGGRMAVATQDTEVLLAPWESDASGVHALKVLRCQSDPLYAEYRQSLGFDALIDRIALNQSNGTYNNSDVFLGATLHTGPTGTWLEDANPPTPPHPASYEAIALRPGLTYRDPQTGTTITAESTREGKLPLKVKLGKTDVDPPDIVMVAPLPDAVLSGPQLVVVEVADSSGVQRVTLRLSGSSEDVQFYPAPGQTFYRVEHQWDTWLAPNGPAFLSVFAEDRSGETLGVLNNIARTAITFVIDNDDVVPPTVTLAVPLAGQSYPNPVYYLVQASDDVGIRSVELLDTQRSSGDLLPSRGPLGNDMIQSWGSEPYEYQRQREVGVHRAQAVAWDFAGNQAASAVVNYTVFPPVFRRGDAAGDGLVDIADPIFILNNLFVNIPRLPWACQDAADANDDGGLDVSDAVRIFLYLFGNVTELAAPGAVTPGPDPTQDVLTCG